MQYGEVSKIEKAAPLMTLPFISTNPFQGYLLNILLNPISPIRPEPRRSIGEGSGTGAAVVAREFWSCLAPDNVL